MKHSIELTKAILLATIFLPGFACATEPEEDSTAWNKLTPENIQTVPQEKLKQEYEKVTVLVENAQRFLAEHQLLPEVEATYQKLLDQRTRQLDIIQKEIDRRAATAAST